VKFGENGQNMLAETFLMEWQNKKLVTVWPEGPASPSRA